MTLNIQKICGHYSGTTLCGTRHGTLHRTFHRTLRAQVRCRCPDVETRFEYAPEYTTRAKSGADMNGLALRQDNAIVHPEM